MQPSASPFPSSPELGKFESLYQTRSFSIPRIMAYVACALAVTLGILALYSKRHTPPASPVYGWVEPAAIGLFVLAFLCLLGGLLHRVALNRVALHRSGVIVEANGKSDAVLWTQVHHYLSSNLGQPFRFTTLDGRQVEISSETAGFSSLCAEIRRRAAQPIFDREWDAIHRGKGADFGPLVLSSDGLNHKGHHYPWSGIEKMYSRITNGHATLTFETSSFLGMGPRIPANTIPSVDVCIQLIEQLAPGRLLSQSRTE
jgi:hypothetical protein